MNTADTPLISVIMPVYNAEKYLAEAIQSALAQTYGNIEIICVDDCSTDGSATILKGWAQKNDNLKVYLLEKNQGVSHARNLAITHAKGEFILPLDADDLIAPEYCRLAMDVFKKTPSVAVVYSRTKLFKDEEFWEWELPEYSKERMQAGNCVHVSAFYRKADWVRFGGYDERLNALVDYDFWLHFTENDLHFFRINQFLFFYRQHATHLNISALYKVDSFKENTTKLQVWLNHKFFSRIFFRK
jgi:glycosyltransferase involved in cell wall biosynthesis